MFCFKQPYLQSLSLFLPIAATAAALPYNEMPLLLRFDKLRNIQCSSVNPETVRDFFASTGIGSTGLFVVIILGPVVVRSILRWQNRLRREQEQSQSTSVMIVQADERKKKDEEQQEPLIFGDNPDYHGSHNSKFVPPPDAPSARHSGRVRHLRIHSLNELPPPTLDDISLENPSWSCPVSPVHESAPSTKNTGKRKSPFNPVVPGMKTTWEEGADPVAGRRWRRKLVVYSSLETPGMHLKEVKVEELLPCGNELVSKS